MFKIYTINNYIMDYNSKTIQELKNICKINKYKNYSKKTKKELIEFIKNKNKKMEGQKVIYKTTGELVTIVKKHFDDIPPYYTIRMSNGNERQTVEDKLSV